MRDDPVIGSVRIDLDFGDGHRFTWFIPRVTNVRFDYGHEEVEAPTPPYLREFAQDDSVRVTIEGMTAEEVQVVEEVAAFIPHRTRRGVLERMARCNPWSWRA